MCSRSVLRVAGLSFLLLIFLIQLVPQVQAMSLLQACGLDEDLRCGHDTEDVPLIVAQVCEACGNYWGNYPGFSYCCRCSEMVFDFCYVAVTEGKK